MAQLQKVLLLQLVVFLFASHLVSTHSESQQDSNFFNMRKLLQLEDNHHKTISSDDDQHSLISITNPTKKKNLSPKNTTLPKLTNTSSPKNQTKPIKTPNLSNPKNQTKLTTAPKTTIISSKTKLNSTSPKPKKLNSTSIPTKPAKSNSTKPLPISSDPTKTTKPKKPQTQTKKKQTTTPHPSWFDLNDDNNDELETDLVSEFTELPLKIQQTLFPDLEQISKTSQQYLTKANKEITKSFKPIVGQKYAPTVASLVSFAFMLIPLLLVSLLFNRIKAYFSLQKLLIFIQVYLSIYFFILCLSSIVTGLEPLRFFYGASRSTYVCVQVLQTLAYVMYLLLLLMYLVLVFSTETGLGSKMLGLAQTFVGFAIGLHYYVAVFHRVVLRQPPRTNWKVHGVYATCFFLICLCATAERRKKAYLEEGGEEGKKN